MPHPWSVIIDESWVSLVATCMYASQGGEVQLKWFCLWCFLWCHFSFFPLILAEMFTYLTKNQWCTGKLLTALLMHSYFIKNNAIVLYYRIWCLQDLGILSPLFDNFGSNTNCLIWKEDWRILVQNKLARVWKCCFSLQMLAELIFDKYQFYKVLE